MNVRHLWRRGQWLGIRRQQIHLSPTSYQQECYFCVPIPSQQKCHICPRFLPTTSLGSSLVGPLNDANFTLLSQRLCKSLRGKTARAPAVQQWLSEATWVALNYCCIELNDTLVGNKMDLCGIMGWFSGTTEWPPCSIRLLNSERSGPFHRVCDPTADNLQTLWSNSYYPKKLNL